MPGTYTPLNEWCDENGHRQFPMADASSGKDDTGDYSIPQNFMVDMILAVPPGYDTSKFYIKSFVVRRLFIDIEIGLDDGSARSVAWAKNIPHNTPRNTSHVIASVVHDTPYKALEMVTGAVVIGTATEIVNEPGSYAFNPSATYIHPARVMEGLACVQSIQVGTDILTGNIVLQEGDNVRFDVVGNTIVVNAVVNEGTGVTIGSDDDIMDALVAEYGQPIVSINGQAPDGNGNFKVAGADCTEVTTGEASVSIDNACAEPCCDKSMLTDVYGVLSQLNLRYAVLESYYQSVGLNINQMQARMVGLEIT